MSQHSVSRCDISFVIVTWNSLKVVRDGIQSIYDHVHDLSFEIFVVDNNSTDGTGRVVAAAFPAVTLIQNQTNLGFGRANNQALQQARGRYFVLLNPDTVLVPGSIERGVRFLDSSPETGVVSGELVNSDGSFQAGYFDFPTLRYAFSCLTGSVSKHFQQWKARYSPDPPIREVDWVSGAFMILRREAVDQVGLFDERFFMYCEETEWCYRIRRAGWKIHYLSEVRIIHHHRQSSKQAPFELRAHNVRSQQILFWTHYPGMRATALTLASIALGGVFIAKGLLQLPGDRPSAVSRIRTGGLILGHSLEALLAREARIPYLNTST